MRTAAQQERKRELDRLRRRNNGNKLSAQAVPYVPAPLILTLIQPLIDQIGISAVANLSPSIGHRGLSDIRNGTRHYVRFDTADKIICEVLGNPQLWYEVPELLAIYQQGTAA